MEFDYSELRGRIKTLFGTQDNFAQSMELGRVSLSQRLNNILEFTQQEILCACILLNEPMERIPALFFTLKVQKHELN